MSSALPRKLLLFFVWTLRLVGIGFALIFYAMLSAQGKKWWLDPLVVSGGVAAAWAAWLLNNKLNENI
jgi:hypothetical protein